MLKQGEEIEVMIIEINRDKERISLGLKQNEVNPWESIEGKYQLGLTSRARWSTLSPTEPLSRSRRA